MEINGLQHPPGKNSGDHLSDSSDAIVFDTASGISLEEQQGILAEINSMSGGSRLVVEAVETKATKKVFLFPLFVNAAAVVFLALGFMLLVFLHGRDEQAIRESSVTLGLTERALIREIRRETDLRISEKETEINAVLSKLSAADTEYRELQVSVENMTEVQRQRAAALLVLLDEYQQNLSRLREEKALILEDARAQEAALRAQAEERVGELSSRIEQTQASLASAAEELKRLGAERDRVNTAESQMGGFYALVNSEISGGRFGEAQRVLAEMREFLDAPSFKGVRSLELKKQGHLAAIAALEQSLTVFSSESGGGISGTQDAALAELEAQNAALEQKTASLERDIAAYSAEGSELDKIIAEYAADISLLESGMAERQELITQRDSEIQNLRAEAARQEQQVAGLNDNLAALQTQNEDIQRQRDDLQRRMEAAIRAFTEE